MYIEEYAVSSVKRIDRHLLTAQQIYIKLAEIPKEDLYRPHNCLNKKI